MEAKQLISLYDDIVAPGLHDFNVMARQYIYDYLKGYTEDNPFECDICIEPEDAMGICSALLPCIDRMWIDDNYPQCVKTEECGCVRDLESYPADELVQIIKELDGYAKTE